VHCSSAIAGQNVQEFWKLEVLGPKGSFEPVSEPKLKVEPINTIYLLERTQRYSTRAPREEEAEEEEGLYWE